MGVKLGRWALLALSVAACGGGPPAVSPRSVSLRLRGTPARATVTIDDRLIGPLDVVSVRGVALAPGAHHVSVEAEGYLPWDSVVEAKDAPVVLDVRLVPVPD
jgi:hypothetical protein